MRYAVTVPEHALLRGRVWLPSVLAIAAALQLTLVNVWPRFESPNERGRAYQALAVAARMKSFTPAIVSTPAEPPPATTTVINVSRKAPDVSWPAAPVGAG